MDFLKLHAGKSTYLGHRKYFQQRNSVSEKCIKIGLI